MEWYWIIAIVIALIATAVLVTHFIDTSDEIPMLRALYRLLGFKIRDNARAEYRALKEETQNKILQIMRSGHSILVEIPEFEAAPSETTFRVSLTELYSKNQVKDIYQKAKKMVIEEVPDYEIFLQAYKIVKVVKSDLSFGSLISASKVKSTDLLNFARAWCEQSSANLKIDFPTAYKFISNGRDFANLVHLDLLAKRAGIELDEQNFINLVSDEELTVIIYSLIRAKYEGIYISEEENLLVNKANVLEYNDSFKITLDLLVKLCKLKRDVKRFTDVMIRAHNSGVNINFSLSDLFALSDDGFETLVNNVIRATDCGINIDQKDLIRQNIQGTDITNLITALIKAHKYNIDLTPDELMSYLVNKKADVEKFVEALNFIKQNDLPLTKDYIVDISKTDRDVHDFVQAYKIVKDYESKPNNYGMTISAITQHFLTFGKALKTVKTIIKAQEELDLRMNFGIANKIMKKGKETLNDAIAWAQNPAVVEVEPKVTCVCKDGIQVTPKVNATVRGKMEQYFWGYRLPVLFARINEAIIYEFELAEDHDQIINNLPQISHNVLDRINEEENKKEIKTGETTETDLNEHCAYNLLDVNIYDVEIGQNVKAELNLRQAQIDSEIRRLKAEADRAKAEADLRIAMVQQYHDGTKPNFNELHKANLLAELSQDITTGYENPQQ